MPSSARLSILILYPASEVCLRLRAMLRVAHDVTLARSAREARELPKGRYDVALVGLDLAGAPGGGISVAQEVAPRAVLVLVTDRLDAEAQRARLGAAATLDPNASRDAVFAILPEDPPPTVSPPPASDPRPRRDKYDFTRLTSQSPRMLAVFDQIRAVATTDATVLVLGETGSGKELVSRAIHHRSKRATRPLISVNCGAFTETLLESELFGHERGSFTGALDRRQGVFEMADGGTLFLDELGETSQSVQVNLLRVLETMRFRRLGGREEVTVDVRIVAATHVALEEAVARKTFREDLYYRLNVFPIRLPPLRERREDIPLLVRQFLDDTSEEYGLAPPIVSGDALGAICSYAWPGNVRQLRTMCERWVITRSGRRLERDDLPTDLHPTRPVPAPREPRPAGHVDPTRTLEDHVRPTVEAVEQAYLAAALERHGYRMDRTSAAAGISRRTLFNKIKQYGLATVPAPLPDTD